MIHKDLAYLLEVNDVGPLNATVFGTVMATIPAGDGPFVSFKISSGLAPERIQNCATPKYEHVGVQVVVTAVASDTVDPLKVANLAWRAFGKIVNFTMPVSLTFYQRIQLMQSPFELLPDKLGRTRWVFNMIVHKTVSCDV